MNWLRSNGFTIVVFYSVHLGLVALSSVAQWTNGISSNARKLLFFPSSDTGL